MTEKQKYKVGDRMYVEGVIELVDATDSSYLLVTEDDGMRIWIFEDYLKLLPSKPKVTQAVMGLYEKTKDKKVDSTIRSWLVASSMPVDVEEWLFGENHLENQHALATLIAYGPEAVEVIKKKKYIVI